MKRVVQLFVLAAIGALLVPALATAAPRMYVGFHDDWDSGQLLSRATSDISAIRRFVGWSFGDLAHPITRVTREGAPSAPSSSPR